MTTHAELRAKFPAAPGIVLDPTECPGILGEPSDVLDLVNRHVARIYHCPRCKRFIVLDREDGAIRNDYPAGDRPPEFV